MPTPKFIVGQSGNPRGRPKAKTPATLLRKSIADDMPEIIKTLISLAKSGDIQAAKILLDRICPSLKPQAMAITLPVKSTLVEQGSTIIKAVMNGQLAPDVGSQLMMSLSGQTKIVELDEVLKRLDALESTK